MSFTSLLQHVFYISFATCLLHLFCNMSCKCRGLSFMSLLRHVSVSLVLCLVCLFFDIGLSFFLSLACFVLYVSLALCLSSKCLFRCANEIYTDARHCARGIVLYSNMNVVSWGTYDWVTRRHKIESRLSDMSLPRYRTQPTPTKTHNLNLCAVTSSVISRPKNIVCEGPAFYKLLRFQAFLLETFIGNELHFFLDWCCTMKHQSNVSHDIFDSVMSHRNEPFQIGVRHVT